MSAAPETTTEAPAEPFNWPADLTPEEIAAFKRWAAKPIYYTTGKAKMYFVEATGASS